MWMIVVLWENLNMWANGKNKLCKQFGIVKYGQLRKLLGVRYEWKIFELVRIYVVM